MACWTARASRISRLLRRGARSSLIADGVAKGGMQAKLNAAIAALERRSERGPHRVRSDGGIRADASLGGRVDRHANVVTAKVDDHDQRAYDGRH